MNSKFIFVLFAVVLLLGMTSAVPTPKVNVNTNVGLNVFATQLEALKYNTTYTPHIHISNISNGFPLSNTVADCFIHLYNSVGEHIYQSKPLAKDINGYDFETTILYGNFTEEGKYNTYYVWCNATALGLGGEVKGSYFISDNGLPAPEGNIVLLFIIILLLLLMTVTVYIIKSIGTIIEGGYDILDLGYAWGLYFGILGTYQLAKIYLGNIIVIDWINLFVVILAVPLVIVPVIAFLLSFFVMKHKRKKEAERTY